MKEANIEDLKLAIESQHGCTATFVEAEPVTETWQGKTVWNGSVYVFEPLAKLPAVLSPKLHESALRADF